MKPQPPAPEDLLRGSEFLLIEDFEAMRSVLKGLLLRCGASRVDTAKDGREATALLSAKSYGVVMCDYNLGPGKNGQQLLEEARLKNWIGPASVSHSRWRLRSSAFCRKIVSFSIDA